ncbi:hypothetical protein ABTC87_18415, partial [Acinetobacter baumannii]
MRRPRAWMAALWCSLGLALSLVLGQAWAQAAPDGGVLPVPALTGHVIDQAQGLSADQARALDAKLAQFEAQR